MLAPLRLCDGSEAMSVPLLIEIISVTATLLEIVSGAAPGDVYMPATCAPEFQKTIIRLFLLLSNMADTFRVFSSVWIAPSLASCFDMKAS